MHEKREDEETNPFRHLAVQHLHGPEEIRCGERELVVVYNENLPRITGSFKVSDSVQRATHRAR
ncbi:MAG: hypothetical protein H0V08_00515 [Thermoleophilaceae bacterium]|nr:hypothetical protein [Thermoleophilaceae bacterium]